MTHLKLNLLGGLGISRDGAPIIGKPHMKARALLAYLAIGGRTHAREALGSFFWPGAAQVSARNNLRQTVFQLRQSLGEQFLLATHDTLRLDHDKINLDVTEFFVLTPSCSPPLLPGKNADFLAQVERKVNLYRGPFLDGLTFENSPDFEDWLCIKRETFHRHALGLLECLSDGHEQNRALVKALQFANRHLELEPCDEAGHRRAMRLLALSGQTGAALAQFEACQRILHKELDARPDAQTVELVNRIKAGKLRPQPLSNPDSAGVVAERRQVTALYCGFSYLNETDPDEIAERLAETRRNCYDIIRRMGGHVAQLHGGAILTYFGYPLASEDTAHKAVRAALALHQLNDVGLLIRVGLHTGMIVSDAELPDTMGLTSNHAIRLRDLDVPVVMSESTFHLTEGYFHVEPLGLQTLRDISNPVLSFRVLGESGATHRLEASIQRGAMLTPFVGRALEIKALLALSEQVRQERGATHIVLIRGEAGIGKSRLIHTLIDRMNNNACTVRKLRCFPESSQSPFHPVIAQIESLCGFTSSDTSDVKFGKLVAHLKTHYPTAEKEALPLLAQLLSLPGNEPSGLSAEKQRKKIGTLLLGLLKMQAAMQPMLYIIEDVHWMDPSSLELLTLFTNGQGLGSILTILTARPEFDPAWKEGNYIPMELRALTDSEVAAIVGFGGRKLPQETIRRIVTRADGVPLFAEEMAKMTQEGLENIPATLRDLLVMKLDKMGAAKRIAQLAATIGRKFDLDLLREISPTNTPLESMLDELQDAGLIVAGIGNSYQFKHALIQEAAYQSQTKAVRQAAHQLIAEVLPVRFVNIVDSQPEIMAQHLTSGGETKRAIEYWLKAGKRATQQSANTEAMEHFKAGLQLIQLLPSDPARDQLEFALQVSLGALLHAVQGYGSPQASEAFHRAMKLCGQATSPELFQTLWGVWVSMMDHFPSALEFAQKLQVLAQQMNDPVLLVQAHYVLGNNQFFLGKFDASHAHSQAAMSIYKPVHHEILVASFGENSSVASGSFLSWSLWFQGFPDQAQYTSRNTLAQARQMGHPHGLAFTLGAAATLNRWMGKSPETLALASETRALASQHNFPVWRAAGMVMQGAALIKLGHKETIAQIKQSIVAMRASMSALTIIFLSILAEAQFSFGQYEAALDAIGEALAALEIIGDSHFEAELYRLKGECLLGLSTGNEVEVKTCFNRAFDISHQQGAKSLELRAAMSLARHFGKVELLSDVYAWFTEGFDTPDLVEARLMLDR